MKKLFLSILILIASFITCSSQTVYPDRLKVFIDCHTGCDMTFIRSEINIVDFSLDRQAADVHVLITEQGTGGGGEEYQLIFFGQNQFKNMTDTIKFITEPNATDFEERDLLLKYMKLGLAPYIARTKMGKEIEIKMKMDKPNDSTKTAGLVTKDPWNYWVFRVQANGNMSADKVYKESSLNGNLSASRITEDIKVVFEFSGGKNKTKIEYDDGNGNLEKFTYRNNNYELGHYLIASINQHWSWGYEATASRSTFSNNKFRALFRTGVEYNIFPYKLVNTKKFTIAYVADVRRNTYIDTTLFDKTKETLFGHHLEAKLSINQKWGTISFGTEYHNYFHNWKYLFLEAYTELEIRITGGLSISMYSAAELIRDQIYLPKEGATPQDVLTRRRQLASGYRFFNHFGISYRFGSKLNNFVNPRFD